MDSLNNQYPSYPKEPWIAIENTGGTRHQSAIRFVSIYPHATAFVVSQDRVISGIFVSNLNNKEIVLYRNFEICLC
jgi:hypothetical protein